MKPALALIPPIDMLEYTDLTKVQLMLPHLVEDARYTYTYKQHCRSNDQYVILDNGVAENVAIDPVDLIDLAISYGVNEVVMPDVIQSRRGTNIAVQRFLRTVEKRQEHDLRVRWLNFMYVVQGDSFEEFCRSCNFGMELEQAYSIGIPRHMIATVGVSSARADLVSLLKQAHNRKPVHLLGASPYASTELRRQWPSMVRSTDTSMPFNYAYADLPLTSQTPVSRPGNYFKLPATAFDGDVLDQNIDQIMSWTS